MTYLLDTSVVTRLRLEAVRARLLDLDGEGIGRTPMTDLEVGCSARGGHEWDRLQEALGAFAVVEVEPHHLGRARGVQRALADQGLRGRKVPDLVIAAVAESASMVVLHYDADYDHIATVTHQRTEWIVERGTIS